MIHHKHEITKNAHLGVPPPFQENILLNADCMDILPLIADNSIDCFVSDIPYKLVAGGCTGKWSSKITGTALNFKSENTKNGNGNFTHNSIKLGQWMPELYRIMKEQSHSYIMVNDRNLIHVLNESKKCKFHLLNVLVWLKNNALPNHWYMKDAEFIVLLRKGRAKYINSQSSKTVIQIDNIKNKKHPTEKPVDLMKIFINNSTNTNDIVLDCFMGSGTTCVAAKELGRRFIGVEIDPNYYQIAINRLSNK